MKTTLIKNKRFSGGLLLSKNHEQNFQKPKILLFVLLLANLLLSNSSFGQIALRASATSTTGTTSLVITKPVGLAVGDVMLANIMQSGTDGSAFNDATSSGWILVAGSNMNPSGNIRFRGTILYKIAVAADVSAANFTFALDADSDDGQGGISAFSGVDIAGGVNDAGAAGGPFDIDPGNAFTNIAADAQLNANGITTTTANAAIVFFGMMANNTNGGVVAATNPSSWTELYDEDFDATQDSGIISSWGTRTTAGATGNASSNLGGSTTNGALLIALKRFNGTIATGTVTGPICAGNNVSVPYTITGTYATGNVFTAQLSSSSGSFAAPTNIGTVTATTAGSITATIPALQGAGTGYRIRVISDFPPATGTDNGSNLTISAAPSATAGPAFNACATATAIPITTGATAANGTVLWTSNGTGTIANATSISTATYTPGVGEAATVTFTLTVTGTSPCGSPTSNKILTLVQPPTAAAGGSVSICQGQTHQVTGATSSNGTIAWTENGAGSITAGSTTLTPTYSPAAGDTGNNVTLTMTVSNGTCANATATYTIHVNGVATAVAGTAVVTCENAGAVNITAGSTSTNNAGVIWTSSGTGSFTNANSMTLATYAPSPADITAGSVTLTLTATGNTPCANATSNKTFTIRKLPTATAGGSATICQNQAHQVVGATSSNGTISWSENGAGSITAGATTNAPTYTAVAGDAGNTVTLTMSVTNSPCSTATATYTIQVLGSATATAGSAFSTCANAGAVNITAGSSAANYSSVAWTSSGTGTFTDANSLTLATYDPSPADVTAGNVTLTLTANGNSPCVNTTSNKVLTILAVPVTTGVTICEGQASAALTSSTNCPTGAPVTAGPNFAGAGTNTAGVGNVDWAAANVNNIVSNNNVYATVVLTNASAISRYLKSSAHGFAIPANATVQGIQVSVSKLATNTLGATRVRDSEVKLVKSGTIVGSNKANLGVDWPTAEAANTYGTTSDLWGTTWTAADINNANFGVVISLLNATGVGASYTASIDYIDITVTYTVPGTLNWYVASSGGSPIGTGSSFNPVGVAGSGLPDTNTAIVKTYYAECSTVAGCRTPTTFTINALPTVTFTGLSASYCESAASVLLTGNHAPSGTFTGAGITDNGNGTATFNPVTAGVGSHAVTYSYTDGNSCPNNAVQSATVNPNVTYYQDADSDGFGNPAVTQVTCTGAPVGYVANNTDCNDGNNAMHTTFPFYADADGDTYGAGSLTPVCAVDANTPPAGYSLDGTDCDDSDPLIFQSALLYTDLDADGYSTGSATICYGATVPAGLSLTSLGSDCNDNDNTVHATFPFYADADGDTFGAGSLTPVCAVDALTPPAGYSLDGTDCNDSDNNIHETFLFYVDADGDTFGAGSLTPACAVDALSPPAGYSVNGTDCNDADAAVYQTGSFFVDADSDGYSSGATAIVCYGATTPSGYLVSNTTIDCNDNIFAINPGHAEVLYNGVDDNCDGNFDEGNQITTSLLTSDCNSTLASIGSLVGIQTLAPGLAYTGWRIRATNGAQVQVIEKNVPHFTMMEFPSYTYATTYTIDIQLQRNGVWLGYYGPTCQISTPAILAEGGAAQVSPSQCGIVLPKINTLIATTSLAGVTGYRFRVTNLTDPFGPNAVQTIDRTQNWFSLQMLARYNYGTTYRIEVSVKSGTGAFGGFGSPCEVSSPPAPSLVNCGGVVASGTAYIAATSVAGATQYRFQITRQSDLASATIDKNVNYFTFNAVPAMVSSPGVLYSIRVAVMSAGTWSPFGDACEITSPGTAARFTVAAPTASSAFKATVYPNPFSSEFAIDVTTSSDANVQVKVYDMLGKLIESREVKVSELDAQKVGDRYPSGVYNVIVSQGGIVKTLRVIKR